MSISTAEARHHLNRQDDDGVVRWFMSGSGTSERQFGTRVIYKGNHKGELQGQPTRATYSGRILNDRPLLSR